LILKFNRMIENKKIHSFLLPIFSILLKINFDFKEVKSKFDFEEVKVFNINFEYFIVPYCNN
jgi:hypothetical protein